MRRLAVFACLLLALGLAACGDDADEDSGIPGEGGDQDTAQAPPPPTATEAEEPSAEGCKEVEQPEPKEEGGQRRPKQRLEAEKTYELTFATSCGSFTVRLDPKSAPKTTASLVSLAESEFFDNTFFHRIVPDFVIQGGDPTGTGGGGPGYSTVDPPPEGAEYPKGTVAMAKTGQEAPGTAGSQFFVVTGDEATPALQGQYALVGKVVRGLDVVERIGALGDAAEMPTQTVVIEDATVKTS